MSKSDIELSFQTWLLHSGLTEFKREYRFAPPRKWRFDFAWPDFKVAVEIDGLLYQGGGGHQTVKGILNDCEKYETAHNLGWIVYRIPGQWVQSGNRPIWRDETMTTLKNLLMRQVHLIECEEITKLYYESVGERMKSVEERMVEEL